MSQNKQTTDHSFHGSVKVFNQLHDRRMPQHVSFGSLGEDDGHELPF
jgi:hypothetical protein